MRQEKQRAFICIKIFKVKFFSHFLTPYWELVSTCFCCEMIEVLVVSIFYHLKITFAIFLQLKFFFLTKNLKKKKKRNNAFYLKLKALLSSRCTKLKFTRFLLSLGKLHPFCNFNDVIEYLTIYGKVSFLEDLIKNIYLKLGQMVGFDYMYIIGISFRLRLWTRH